MKRREFLGYFAALCASIAVGDSSAYADWLKDQKKGGLPLRILVIDAHAHPDQFYYLGPEPKPPDWIEQFGDDSSTLEKIKSLGMCGSAFAAIGDSNSGSLTFDQVMVQLDRVISLEEQGLVRIVRHYRDMPQSNRSKRFIPGAILSLEGATPLGEDLEKVDQLYEAGVRLITPMHYRVNDIGDVMTEESSHGGLTSIGQQMVERMMRSGIVVDAAHAHFNTLQGMAEIARIHRVPLIDSHTSLTRRENPYGTTRLRTFAEMEMIAETGGVVCTWPMSWYTDESHHRTSFLDWARENLAIAKEIGIEHVGLGTDGGGRLPAFIDDYESIVNLPKLVEAMDEVGFKQSQIKAYMGKNLSRVLKKCIG